MVGEILIVRQTLRERICAREPTSDEFTVKVATNPEDVKSLLEAGFEYVCQNEGLVFLRKRK